MGISSGPNALMSSYSRSDGSTSVVGVFVVLAVIMCVLALGFPYSHDEELYVAAARLSTDQRLYSEFFYGQTPYYPSILGPLLAAVPSVHILTVARLFSALAGLLLMVVIYRTLRELSVDRYISLVLVAVVALSPTMLPSFSVGRNDSLPALFGAGAIWLILRSLRNPRTVVLPLGAGFLSACAVLTKVTWSFVPLCVGAFLALTCFRRSHGSIARLAAYVIGGVAGTLPAVPFAVAAPSAMFMEIVVYPHLAIADWYVRIGQTGHFDWHRVLYRYVRFLAQPVGALILLTVVILWRYGMRKLFDELMQAVHNRSSFLLLGICTLGAMAFALFPRALNVYYFAPIVVMTALLTGTLLARIQPDLTSVRRAVLAVCALLVSVPGLAHIATVSDYLRRGAGGVQGVAADAVTLGSHLCGLARPALVATLSPIRVMGAGHRIYPELVAGPFLFRSAHLWTAEQLVMLRGAGPHTIAELFSARRPDAVYVGHERWNADPSIELDGALVRWAVTHGYREIPFPGSMSKKTFIAPDVAGGRACP